MPCSLPSSARRRFGTVPSGHSAAAFAFATGVGHELPPAAIPLHGLAALVAYSQVHTGVHYPGDVIAGVRLPMLAPWSPHRRTRDLRLARLVVLVSARRV